MSEVADYVRNELFRMQDIGYRDFHSKLMPTIDKETIIGVRTPQLRKFAKAFARRPEASRFLEELPHFYYEENNLHGFLLERIKDYDMCVNYVNAFLPYVDNWATCDMMKPKAFEKHLPRLLKQITLWLGSEHAYTVRFGIGMLMNWYLDENFEAAYPEMVVQVRSEEYYVNMMIAWYFATALAKQYEAALPYLERRRMDPWTHNRAIQKALESRRITPEQKAYLRSLKWK